MIKQLRRDLDEAKKLAHDHFKNWYTLKCAELDHYPSWTEVKAMINRGGDDDIVIPSVVTTYITGLEGDDKKKIIDYIKN